LAGVLGLLVGCSRTPEPPAQAATTLVTVARASTRDVPVVLRATGRLQSRAAPAVAAEVAGRVLRIFADEGDTVAAGAVLAELDATGLLLEKRAATAEIGRIEALQTNAAQRVARFRALTAKGSVSKESLDDAEAELAVLRAGQEAAEARLRIVEDQLARTLIRAPIDGRVDRRFVSPGDFVNRGTALFELTTGGRLRALLPFPESEAARLSPGLPVRLQSPLLPGEHSEGVIAELRPAVGSESRALWAIVDIDNPGGWRPEGTVVAMVTVETRRNAVVVPIGSIVRRPAGSVVYAIEEQRAVQRIVNTGERLDGLIEILGGLAADELVAVEGASYLSDGAAVRIDGEQP